MVMRTRYVCLLGAFILFYALWPALTFAQQPKAGVITTLQGQATVARPALPQPVSLKFKDDVFQRDRIDTRENSIARVLLAGKALVTIRELSTFTVTEEPGRAVVDIQSGQLALGVARSLLRPGESVEVRTPHAIAAVRGSLALFIVTARTTEIRLLEGLLEVISRIAPTVPTVIRPNDLVTVADKVGSVGQMTPAQRQATVQGTQAPKPKEQSEKPQERAAQQAADSQVKDATQLAAALTGPAPPPADVALVGAASPVAAATSAVGPTSPSISTAAIGVQATSATKTAQQLNGGVTVVSFGGQDILSSTTKTLTFSSATDVKTFEVVTSGTTWFVSVKDCCSSGDKWKAAILQGGKELTSTTGDGSITSFSTRTGVSSTGSKTFDVKVTYTTGVDVFPAGMDTKFDTTAGSVTVTAK
jgi:hypothetical protein